ncbi:MAG: DUF4836 family protein [Bacteroidota bacterium]|nr:DUF4836 family protein [Bacteroidota bacterium]
MFKTNFTHAGWLLVIVLFAVSCKSSAPKQTKYIPKDASVVLAINPKKLSDKLADSKVSLDSILRSAVGSDTSLMITSNDITNSGIDLSKDIFLFVNQTGSMMSGSSATTGIVAVLNKVSQFEDFLKKKMPSAQIKKEKDYSYATGKNGFVVGWNDDIVLIDNVTAINPQTAGQSATPDAAHQQLTALFAQKEDASLASVKQFKDANDGKADVFFWSNSNGALATIPMLGMSKASDLLKDTYTAGAINFEKGEVDMDLKSYPNTTLADTLKKYAGPKVNMDLLTKYPGAVNGYALFSFDPKIIVAILNFAGLLQTTNQFLQNQGYTMDDIVKAFKGDFAIVFSNFGMQQKNVQGFKYSSPYAKLVVDAAIGDKASYDKIVASLAKQGLMVQKNGQYVPAPLDENPQGFTMYTDNKNVLFSNDSALMKQYNAGSGKITLPSDISGKTKGTAVAFYVDVASILNTIPKDSSSDEMINSAKQTFKDVIATTDNYSNSSVKSHLELRTVNQKENSLATLTRYFGSLSATMKRMKEATGTDDINVNPPTSILPDTSATMESPGK